MPLPCNIEHAHQCHSFGRYDILLSKIFQCSFSPANPRNGAHRHQCYELCFVMEGEGLFVCGSTTHRVTQNAIFIVSPNVVHEILCGENGWLRLWFFTFAIAAAPYTSENNTETGRIVEAFLHRHDTVAPHCAYLASYESFLQAYAQKGGVYALNDVALLLLLDCMQALSAQSPPDARESEAPIVHRIAAYVSSHIQSSINAADLCAHVHVSHRTLYLLFERHFKTTPAHYINTEKINTSIGYLNMGFPIKTVAELMGFSEASAYSRLFKKTTGQSPAGYLKSRIGME